MSTKTTPFTFTDEISFGKRNILTSENEDQYVPFIINRHLSMFPDTLFAALDMNTASHLPKSLQFQYLLNTVNKRRRFTKWKRRANSDVLQAISNFFACNLSKAEELSQLLPEKTISELKELYSDGSSSKKIRRSKAKKT